MAKRALLLTVFLFGCADRVSLGDYGSGNDPLSVEEPAQNEKAERSAASASAAPSEGSESSATPVTPDGIEYIEVDEQVPVARKIRVDASCRVTAHGGLDAIGDPTQCEELFRVAVVLDGQNCGPLCRPDDCVGTVRMHMKDGRDFVRDLSKDKCSVYYPSVMAHKFTFAVWYGVGGGD